MMNWEEPKRISGRRSKLDIACDVLKVISKGAQSPTRIMSRSNLTWPLAIAYLGVLLKNQMIAVESREKGRVYRITPRGSSLLRIYADLQEAAGVLELDKIDTKAISKAISTPRVVMGKEALVESVRELLGRAGHSSSATMPKSASGAEHKFDLVMYDREGVRTGYLIKESINEVDVILAFVMQTDCEIQVCIICRGDPPKQASELAESYGLKIIRYGDLSGTNLTAGAGAL